MSFTFGIQGPCAAFDTACSSALVALHAAVRNLERGDCDLALVSGVLTMLTPTASIACAVAGMTSPTGRCHTFDAAADGYVRGEGCGAVVLERMDDAILDHHRIHAMVQGIGVAQDGTSASLTAPNGKAQEKLLRSTLADAQISGREVDCLEAHGTGTALGDPIEMGSAFTVFGEDRNRGCPLVVGSAKANIGHLEPGAGAAGLIKAVLALQHEQVPPNSELKVLNPRIKSKIEDISVHFPMGLESLRLHTHDESLKAGVSSFGYAGTIAHTLIAQPPREMERDPPEVLPNEQTNLLERPSAPAPIMFLFTGQGSQYVDMGLRLYGSEPVFCTALDRCADMFADVTGESLLEVIYSSKEGGEDLKVRLNDTRYTQPALFAIEWSLAELWRSRDVVPCAVLGHSVGEIVAACVAGAMTVETGMQLVAQRSRLMQVGGGLREWRVMQVEQCCCEFGRTVGA